MSVRATSQEKGPLFSPHICTHTLEPEQKYGSVGNPEGRKKSGTPESEIGGHSSRAPAPTKVLFSFACGERNRGVMPKFSFYPFKRRQSSNHYELIKVSIYPGCPISLSLYVMKLMTSENAFSEAKESYRGFLPDLCTAWHANGSFLACLRLIC